MLRLGGGPSPMVRGKDKRGLVSLWGRESSVLGLGAWVSEG